MKTLSKILFLSFAIASSSSFAGKSDQTLDIYWIDSEGGGSTLIVTPNDESVLIDTGNPGGRDAGRIHKVAKEVAGLKQIDHMVITHFHIDHFGGAAELSDLMPVKYIYDKGIPATLSEDPTFPLKIKSYKEIKGHRVTLQPGWDVNLSQPGMTNAPRLTLKVLAANQQFIRTKNAKVNKDCGNAKSMEKDTTDNANSLVLLLQYGNFKFFDGGDLTWNTEGELVCPTNRVGMVDVYQSNHHGLDVSNNPLLIQALAPTIAVYNNGPRKGCEPESFSTLKKTSSVQAIYQLHKNVQAKASNTADDHIANLEEKCQAHYLKLSVTPDGKSYTMFVPSTGHQKTYQSKAAAGK